MAPTTNHQTGRTTGNFPQRVLIIDDNPLQRRVLRRFFEGYGSRKVDEAENGFEAQSLIETVATPHDLTIIEMEMPEYDGIKLISYLESRNVRTRVLLLSGLPEDVVRMSNALARASGLVSIGSLQKPLQPLRLLAIVNGQRWPSGKARRSKHEYIEKSAHT